MRRLSWAILALLTGCDPEGSSAPAAEPEARSAPEGYTDDGPYRFRDATAESGLSAFRQVNGEAEKPFIVETVGGGVGLFDADGDGDLDAYLTNGGRLGRPLEENPSDALFRNDGSGRFEDRTRESGIDERRWTVGVRAADVDADGALDLYLTNYGPNVLYRNRGGGVFEDVTESAGVGDPRWSTGACFLDHDKDGDLDLYVANYVEFDEPRMLAERPVVVYKGVSVMKGPQGLPAARHRFYANAGGLRFRDASSESGIDGPELYGFQSVALDFDLDGWIDVFVACDSVQNLLWRNLEGQRFEDVALRQGVAFSLSGRPQAGMGVGVGDFDADLLVDLYVTNFSDDYSTLYRGEERGFFRDVSPALGLTTPTMDKLAWGTGFEDLDGDGDLEIYVVNGHVYPQVDRFRLGTEYRQPLQLFEQVDGSFREPAGRGGTALGARSTGRGAATGDVDGDGDVDLLIENLDGPPRLLLNDGPQGRWLQVLVIGSGANREAVGARVVARSGGRSQLRLVGTSSGFCSSSSPVLHLGLGTAETLEELEVTWPDGRTELFRELPTNARVTIEQGASGAAARLETKPSR